MNSTMAGAKKRIWGSPRPEQHTEPRLRACFLSLPAELRNQIYHLCLDTSTVFAIKDMHPIEFRARKEENRCPWRSAYTAPDHCRGMCADCPGAPFRIDCSFTSPRMMFDMTTYLPGNATALENTTIAIIAVNHQIREEAASLFYGSNTFTFGTMSSLVPFLKDRAPDTRKYINSLQLELHIYESNWYPSFAEHGRSEAWKRAFTALKKLPHFQLKRLRIRVNDRECHFYSEGLKLHTPQMRWLHRLADISTLDSLGVQYLVRHRRSFSDESYRGSYKASDKRDTQNELWEFLAPKMLTRVEGKDHDAEALKHRRIALLGSRATISGNWEDTIVISD